MSEHESMERARAAALDRVEKSQRSRRLFMIGAILYEGVILAAFLALADLSNMDHILLFLAACLVYGTLAFGLLALSAHVSVCTQRLMQALTLKGNE